MNSSGSMSSILRDIESEVAIWVRARAVSYILLRQAYWVGHHLDLDTYFPVSEGFLVPKFCHGFFHPPPSIDRHSWKAWSGASLSTSAFEVYTYLPNILYLTRDADHHSIKPVFVSLGAWKLELNNASELEQKAWRVALGAEPIIHHDIIFVMSWSRDTY